MKLPAIARTSAAGLALLIVVGAFSLVPAARPSPTGAPSAGATSSAVATPTRPPTSAPVATATLIPSDSAPSPSAPALATPRRGGNGGPPAGLLASGDVAVAGHPGSYCYGNRCVDSVWPFKSDLPLITIEADSAIFALEGATPFVEWAALYSARSNSGTHELGRGGSDFDPDAVGSPPPLLLEAQVAAPPSGEWVVNVFVRFEGGGDASYAWHVIVP